MQSQTGNHRSKFEETVQNLASGEEQLDPSKIQQVAQETAQKWPDPDSSEAIEFLCLAEGGVNKIAPKVQRALVLQGGGAPGAYEAGVLNILSKNLRMEDKENKDGKDMLELRMMLENDLHAVQKVIDAFRGRIKNASENNDYGTEHMLKGIIFEYEEMADRLEHYLAMESLERNLTTR